MAETSTESESSTETSSVKSSSPSTETCQTIRRTPNECYMGFVSICFCGGRATLRSDMNGPHNGRLFYQCNNSETDALHVWKWWDRAVEEEIKLARNNLRGTGKDLSVLEDQFLWMDEEDHFLCIAMAGIPVFVFVGNWICHLNGEWDVEFVEGYYGHSVDISGVETLDGLMTLIADLFQINRTENSMELSYWIPDFEIYRSYPQSEQLRDPPVLLFDDEDVHQFSELVRSRPSTNLYLAIEIRRRTLQNYLEWVTENDEDSQAQDDSTGDMFSCEPHV